MTSHLSLDNKNTFLSRWLILCCALVVIMVAIGGFTRLTHSGLSIVEWKPVSGIIPPLTETDWQEEFTKYKTSPEYKSHNYDISLSDFKFIFTVEFVHRLAGRITGLVFLFPFVLFLITGEIRKKYLPTYGIILLLLGLQGFMGWYMVKSGLVDLPHVSHFRLAFHLLLAVIIYSLLFWQLMLNSFDILLLPSNIVLKLPQSVFSLSLTVLLIQIFLGGMVAGLDAGLVYNSFPLMGDSFIPPEVGFKTLSLASFYDPVFIQFIHRINGYILALFILFLCRLLFQLNNSHLNKASYLLFAALVLQVLSGVITLLYSVPMSFALLHQLSSIILLSCLLWCGFLLKSADL